MCRDYAQPPALSAQSLHVPLRMLGGVFCPSCCPCWRAGEWPSLCASAPLSVVTPFIGLDARAVTAHTRFRRSRERAHFALDPPVKPLKLA
jgi:hypothetical protein